MTIFRFPRSDRHAALAAGLAASLTLAMAAQASTPVVVPATPQNVLNLGVAASREVVQDTLAITLAVSREGADASALQSDLRQILDTALTQARRAVRSGYVEVRTGTFSINPRYVSRPGGASAQSGWQGRAELVLEGTDTGAISQLAGRLTGLTVARVAFSLSREARERVETEVAALEARPRVLVRVGRVHLADESVRKAPLGLEARECLERTRREDATEIPDHRLDCRHRWLLRGTPPRFDRP